jgi:LuxR family maltose regulon positive regulatory protein
MRAGKASADRRPGGAPDRAHRPAKLLRPALSPHYLPRPRLVRLLDEAVAQPLVVVSAAAGTGKTALLAEWSATTDRPTAWLTLGADHADAAAFVTDVLAAIDELVSGGARPIPRPAADADPPADALTGALERLGSSRVRAATVVIDNVQAAQSATGFAALLETLITYAPAWLHIVLLTRSASPLRLDLIRAGGHVAEVRAADLMFTAAEATELLGRLAPLLSPPEILALVDLAGGWAAGLQLAASAVRGGQAGEDADATRAEYNTLVRSYVLHEVLGAESPEVVALLNGLAVVEGGDAQLASTLTRRDDALDVFADVQARGLVTTAPGGGSFAVHPFIRAVLLDEMAGRSPQQAVDLHVRAARSFEATGDTVHALDQWLLAGNPDAALRLLAEEATDLYDTGHQATVLATIAAIPVEVATKDFPSMVDFAWCHLLVSRRRFFELVDQVDWWAARTVLDGPLRPRVTMLRSFAASLRGRWREAAELARAAMDDLGAGASSDRLGRFGWNMVARERAMTESWTEGGPAEREMVLGVSRNPHRRIAMEATRALGQALAGDVNRALRTAADVRQSAPAEHMAILRAELVTAEGIAHRELGHRARASAHLEDVARAVPEPMTHCAVLGLLELTELQLSEQDVAGAVTTFEWARVAEQDAELVGELSMLARVGAAIELARGDAEAARAWAQKLDDPFWAGATTARVLLAQGDGAGAFAAARAATPRCPRHRVVLNLLWARLARSGDDAMEFVISAVTEAAAHGMRQTVASQGADILALVERAAWVAPSEWMDDVRRLAAVADGALGYEPVLRVTALSPRERDVLRTLPSRLTTREIAGELGISVNTLKYHIKAIYRKLGVTSRAEAAEVARQIASSSGGSGRRGGSLRPPEGLRGPARA